MKANPGGQIEIKSVIGRDRLIQHLWETLEQQSLVITAERRIGKTTVMKKMEREPNPGWLPVYQDLESCHTAMEFAMAVYREVDRFLGGKQKLARRSKEFFKGLGGTEIGGILKLPEKTGAPWKELLTQAIEDLMRENNEGTRLLFLWDELPFMLMNIKNGEGEQTAMRVLDHLRWLRQTHSDLRMVITGSIGLHHVITALKDQKYSNAPINDLAPVDIPPLSLEDAALLAGLLIAGENLRSPEPEATTSAIAREADCFAFYVHHIVRALKVQGLDATAGNAAMVVAANLVDHNDPWQLQHYRERLRTYYPEDEKTVGLILDQLAVEPGTASVNELLALLKGISPFDDRDRLVRLLSLMGRDHYLRQNADGRFLFRFPLIRRCWKLTRGL